jgi:hypothetical protein
MKPKPFFEHGNIKIYCDDIVKTEAIDLAKEDGLLPKSLTKEEYDRIASKTQSF